VDDVVDDLARDLRDRLHEDKAILHKNRALFERVAAACAEDGLLWSKCRDVLREAKVIRDWEKKIKLAARELQGVRSIGADPAPTNINVKEVWSDAPVSDLAEMPRGWGLNSHEAAVYQVIEKTIDGGGVITKHLTVSYEPLLIRRLIKHTDQNKILVELVWRKGKHWHRGTYDRDTVFSKNDIVGTAADGVPVRSDNALDIVKFLGAYEYHNLAHIEHEYASSSMGWKGTAEDPTRDGFLCGNEHMCKTEKSKRFMLKPMGPGDKDEAATVRSVGTFAAWKEAIAVVAPYAAVRIGIYASLASVLLPILRAPNAIIEWVKGTSTGKTSALQVIQSIWRSPTTQIASWNNSLSNFESRAHLWSGLPLFLDDTKLVTTAQGRKGEELLGKTIYMFVNGTGRGRDTRTGGQRTTTTWRSIMFSTGEVPSSDLAHAEGASARVLSFWTAPFGASNKHTGAMMERLINTQLAENFGHAGPMFVKWLHEHRERWDMLRGAYEETTLKVRAMFNSPSADRLSRVIALIEVTAAAAHAAELIPWKPCSIVDDPEIQRLLRASVAQAESGADDATRAWEHVLSDAESKASQWATWGMEPNRNAEPSSGWLGWKSPTRLAWLPSQLKRVLDQAGYNFDTIRRAWRERGWIEPGPPKRPYVKFHWCADTGKQIRTVVMITAESEWGTIGVEGEGDAVGDDE